LEEWINEPGCPPGTRTAGELPAEPLTAVRFEPLAPDRELLACTAEPPVPEPEPVEPAPVEPAPVEPVPVDPEPPEPDPPPGPEPPPDTPPPWCECGDASWRAESSGIEYIAPAGLSAFGSVA
jgi:hypothetical protein